MNLNKPVSFLYVILNVSEESTHLLLRKERMDPSTALRMTLFADDKRI